jgi:hypothetical protein
MCKPWGLWLKRHQVFFNLMWHLDGVLLVQMFKASSTTFIVFFFEYIYIYIYWTTIKENKRVEDVECVGFFYCCWCLNTQVSTKVT